MYLSVASHSRNIKMTKLLEWLLGGFLFLGVWSALVFNRGHYNISDEQNTFIILLPVIVIGIFGIYAASVVLWRVFTFNNCEEAAVELQKQILEAKENLKSKGMKFDDSS